MPVKKQTQKQKQRQSVVIHIGDKYAKRKRAARRSKPKKAALPAAEPLIVPFTRIPPIWVQQPEPMRPFASNEPPQKPMSLASAAVNAPAAPTATAPVPVPVPTPLSTSAAMPPPTRPMTPAKSTKMSIPPLSRQSSGYSTEGLIAEAEKVIREVSPPKKERKPFTKYIKPSYETGFATESETESSVPRGGGFRKAAPSVEQPMSLSQIVESGSERVPLSELRKRPVESLTAEEKKRIERQDKLNAKLREKTSAHAFVTRASAQEGAIGVGAIFPHTPPAAEPSLRQSTLAEFMRSK